MKIRCSTLFDVTHTGISHRRNAHLELTLNDYIRHRNQQSNLETILQVVSLRAQPEDVSASEITVASLSGDSRWGTELQHSRGKQSIWSFTFTVQGNSIWAEDDQPLGRLFRDCNGVPMLLDLSETVKLPGTLCTDPERRNIWFVLEND